MRKASYFILGFNLGLLFAIVVGRGDQVLHDVALRPFLVKDLNYAASSVTLVDSDGDRKTVAQGDTLVLPVWRHE